MSEKRRIGIMGGTFNPIHYGHLIIAENACEQFDLDQVLFIPTGHTPHKKFSGKEMTYHRCEMVRLAIKDNPHFSISLCEVEQNETCYTYKTLELLQKEYPDADLYFILGADSLDTFDSWVHPELICQRAAILAAVRDDLNEAKVDEMITELSACYHGRIYRLETPNFNVSSHTIRTRLQNGQTVRYIIPEKVEQYIQKHHLYQEMPVEVIKKHLREELKHSRYIHTLGVMDTAVHLAEKHGCDVHKAQYAGLLHDCAKCISDDEKIAICRSHDVEISDAELAQPSLLHAKCGEIFAEEKYGVTDPEILHAIRVHTTGCPAMNLLDKIIFISDYIEPNRDQAPHLKELRQMAESDLDQTLYQILDDTISYLKNTQGTFDQTTLDTYSYYKNIVKLCKK